MRISDWSSDVCSSDLEQRAELIALAPQSDDQHATRIGVLRERREQRARMAEIVAKLRTTEGVLERMDAVDAPRMARARDPRDARGEVADAADGRQDRKSTRLNSVTNAQLVCRLPLEKKKHT